MRVEEGPKVDLGYGPFKYPNKKHIIENFSFFSSLFKFHTPFNYMVKTPIYIQDY